MLMSSETPNIESLLHEKRFFQSAEAFTRRAARSRNRIIRGESEPC